ncbi:hypothetical protein O0L34_g3799 [Tuta absoluta]|nr:hypothetical protein O0L34_g3799 [Tuta absoluta]
MFLLLLFFALVGVVALCFLLVDSLWSVVELVTSFLTPYFLPGEEQSLAKRFGPWAAITGSTDGIGKQYALELAKRGLNVVLISRNPEKLRAVAAEIEKEHKVKTKIIVADFSKGPEVYPHIENELRDLQLGIFVNNVGVQYEYPMPLCEVPTEKAWELIHVNIGAVTHLTRAALVGMRQRKKGAIVNISSGSELQPLPLMTIYAATKAYVRSFTLAIREEYASEGIHVQHVAPLFVSTKINAFSERLLAGNLLVPDAATYARHAVATLGRVSHTSGFWIHGIQTFFTKLAPVWIRTKIGMYLNQQFRQEYLANAKLKAK